MDTRTSEGPIADHAQAALFDALATGQLRSGQFASMPQLVAMLGYPIAAVRDAVKTASALGLIEVMPKRGIQVMDATPETTWHCLDFRAMLDMEGARRLIASGAPMDLDGLRAEHLGVLQAAHDSVGTTLSQTAIRTDLRLHDHLSRGLANPVARRSYAVNRIRIAIIQNSRPFVRNRIVSAMEEHLAIMDALERRDAPGAVAAIRTHFENTLEWWGVPLGHPGPQAEPALRETRV